MSSSATADRAEESLLAAEYVLRLLMPDINMASTTALETLHPDGRLKALQSGANVFMPNNTPVEYRERYLLYPDKPCVDETPGQCAACVLFRIEILGRNIGEGPGHALPR